MGQSERCLLILGWVNLVLLFQNVGVRATFRNLTILTLCTNKLMNKAVCTEEHLLAETVEPLSKPGEVSCSSTPILSFVMSYFHECQTCIMCSLMWIIALVGEDMLCGDAGWGWRPRPRSAVLSQISGVGLAKPTCLWHIITAELQHKHFQFTSSWRGRSGDEKSKFLLVWNCYTGHLRKETIFPKFTSTTCPLQGQLPSSQSSMG